MEKKITSPHPVDIHVGKRLRMLRVFRCKSQSKLADALGLTFQQVQKYEGGVNRISASTLFIASKFLCVSPGYFFEGLDNSDDEGPPILDRKTIQIANMISRISDKEIKSSLYYLIKGLTSQAIGPLPPVSCARRRAS